MRLWTLHPMYLDAQGLVALWREALLAQRVLQGATRGYRAHPQLTRFRAAHDPLGLIGAYLGAVQAEARTRGYAFDASRIVSPAAVAPRLLETEGQLLHEWRHLLQKLQRRAPSDYQRYLAVERPIPHPLFDIVPGPPAEWERGVPSC